MPDASPVAVGTRPAKLFSVDTPLSKLCNDPYGKAVVDRDLPGLTSRPEYVFFKHMSLRQLQAASNGRMTAVDLAKVSLDLDIIGTPTTGLAGPLVRASATLR